MNYRILRDFFHGDLSPADRLMASGSEAARLTEEVAKAEDILTRALAPDLAAVLKRLTAAQAALDSFTAETCYIAGFRTGARFMMEVLDDSRENLKPATD